MYGTGSSAPSSSCDHASALDVSVAGASTPGATGARPVAASAATGAIPVAASAAEPYAANSAAPTAASKAGCGVVTTGVLVCSERRCAISGMLAPPPTVTTAATLGQPIPLRSNVFSKASRRPPSGAAISDSNSVRVNRIADR